jgi:DNA-binding PadR family transcriptional regulator
MQPNEIELLKALEGRPLEVHEITFSKSTATLYRTLAILRQRNWIDKVEASRYALTEKGRRALELLGNENG